VAVADVVIRPIALADVAAFHVAVTAVIRERVYLARTEPFSTRETTEFVRANLRNANPQILAEAPSGIVGWCDVVRQTIPAYAHSGVLGIGVVSAYRGRGLGERLIKTALDAARRAGMERVGLQVYARNTRAVALYRKVGFAHEGTLVRGKKVDGEYDDVLIMGLLL
jgi:RimJ/RimL family protein N-acetyltransferase